MDDAELLRRYTEDHSEEAFAELVRRHIGFVYAVAARRLDADKHLAEDVTQSVFVDLARKAPGLSPQVVLTGWLFNSVRFAASRAARTEQRRRSREQKAYSMNHSIVEGAAIDWESLRPLLDELIGKLPERDRQAVLLRFFAADDFTKIGEKLAMSPDGARTRVNRALDKLQAMLTKHGVVSTGSALTAVLANQPLLATPAGLSTSITKAALAAAAAKSATGFLAYMTINKAVVGFTGAFAAAGVIGFVVQQRTNSRLHDEIALLRQQTNVMASLRVENERLIKAMPSSMIETDKTRTSIELARAREEIATLKRDATRMRAKESADAASAAMIPSHAWTNAGMTTPAATYQTAMWAHREADLDALAKTFTFSDADKAKVDALFATLPEETRTKFGSPEKMIALIFAAGEGPESFRVVSQTQQDENTMTARVQLQRGGGGPKEANLVFRRGPEGWQMIVPSNEVANQIRKIKGELPLPKE
jgi:RNA polymerase sigma factor (sigma-70 family)